MVLIKALDIKFLVNLLITVLFTAVIYYFYGYAQTGITFPVPANYLKILEYVLCGVAILQLFTAYNIIQKVLFNETIVLQLATSLKENNDKLLEKFSPEEAVIYNGSRLIFDQYLLFIIYGFSMAFLGANLITFSGFLLLPMLISCISWFFLKYKINQYFKEK